MGSQSSRYKEARSGAGEFCDVASNCRRWNNSRRMRIEVLLTPVEQAGLAERDLGATTCVVFDVLRATSVMAEALANGAAAIAPVCEIGEAVALREGNPDWLLAGERDGLKITAALSGGPDFDLGNSPREFTREAIAGRTIVTTTTNGTRALMACKGAAGVLVGSFLNLRALIAELGKAAPEEVLLVCAGTGEGCASEDVLCAGAVVDGLNGEVEAVELSDSALVARAYYREGARGDETEEPRIAHGANGRRLLEMEDLREDVAFCSRIEIHDVIGEMGEDGLIQTKRTA